MHKMCFLVQPQYIGYIRDHNGMRFQINLKEGKTMNETFFTPLWPKNFQKLLFPKTSNTIPW